MKFDQKCKAIRADDVNASDTLSIMYKVRDAFNSIDRNIYEVFVHTDECLIVDTIDKYDNFYRIGEPLSKLGLYISSFETKSYATGGSRFWIKTIN
jgi:hypothetical protein